MPQQAKLKTSSVVQWSAAPVSTEVEDEVVLLSLERGRCYGLGETGSAVWRKLNQPIRVDTLCEALSAEYHADPATVTADVLALLEELHGEGLVDVS